MLKKRFISSEPTLTKRLVGRCGRKPSPIEINFKLPLKLDIFLDIDTTDLANI